MATCKNDKYVDADTARVLARGRYTVENVHVDGEGLAVAEGLRAWGWNINPEAQWIKKGTTSFRAGAENPPNVTLEGTVTCYVDNTTCYTL